MTYLFFLLNITERLSCRAGYYRVRSTAVFFTVRTVYRLPWSVTVRGPWTPVAQNRRYCPTLMGQLSLPGVANLSTAKFEKCEF